MKKGQLLRAGFPAVLVLALAACSQPAMEFEKGDHIVLIGNALADRMRHDGWLETYLQTELQGRELVFRNQGFAGDKINDRPRGQGFMTAGDYLSLSKADVIFAMFGYNESFDDDSSRFGLELAAWIDSTKTKDYSGKGAPRIVLFSPIAHEDLGDPNLPDGTENNRRLAAYTERMRIVAEEKQVLFIDLFEASNRLYEESNEPLTINGVHHNSEGNRTREPPPSGGSRMRTRSSFGPCRTKCATIHRPLK